MQTEPNIKNTDTIGSADVSSGATPSTGQAATPEKNEPKKRGRKKGYHHSEATKAAMRKARNSINP